MTESAVTTLLHNVGTILSSAATWVGTLITKIVGSPLLLAACLLPLVGYGIHMLKMLLSAKA